MIPLIYLKLPTVWKTDQQDISELSHQVTWMTPLIDYIANGFFPDDKNESRKIKTKATKFTIIEGQLFIRSFCGPYLTCITRKKILNVLAELHYRECGNHLGV